MDLSIMQRNIHTVDLELDIRKEIEKVIKVSINQIEHLKKHNQFSNENRDTANRSDADKVLVHEALEIASDIDNDSDP